MDNQSIDKTEIVSLRTEIIDHQKLSPLQISLIRMVRRGLDDRDALIIWGMRESGKKEEDVRKDLECLQKKDLISIS